MYDQIIYKTLYMFSQTLFKKKSVVTVLMNSMEQSPSQEANS